MVGHGIFTALWGFSLLSHSALSHITPTGDHRETENINDEYSRDYEGGYVYLLGQKKKKKARLVCDLGMLKILPSFGFGILPMQHVKELHIQPACSKGYLIWQV